MSGTLDSADRDTWYRGSEEVSGPPKEASSVLWLLGLRVGLGSALEAELALPIAWMDARDGTERAEQTSVGDLATRLSWTTARRDWSFGATVGAYWPVGELGTDGLPATATFSSGTIDPTAGVHLRGPQMRGIGWQLSTNARFVLSDQDNGARLGSSFSTSVAVDRPLGDRLVVQMSGTHFHRQSDRDNPMEDSGGDWFYLQPQLLGNVLTRADQSIQAFLGLRIPVYQNVRGLQLADSASFSFGIAYTREF